MSSSLTSDHIVSSRRTLKILVREELGSHVVGDPTPHHLQRIYLGQLAAAGSDVDYSQVTDEKRRPFELAAALLHRHALLDTKVVTDDERSVLIL